MTDRFREGQVLTVFRSRFRPDRDPRYEELDAAMRERVAALGGLIEMKTFIADDGERATLVTFADRASHERWATEPTHRDAQRVGRASVYESFSVQVAECTSARAFQMPR